MTTLVLDKMPEFFWQIVKEKYADLNITENKKSNNIEIIILRTKTKLYAQDLARYPKLKMIIRAGSGFDNIDVKAASKRKIAVCTTPGANTQSAFEHTIAFILAMIKQHQEAKSNILSGNWKQFLNHNWELSDLKVLLVGVGRIGSKVGGFLKSFGADVKGVDPYLSEKEWAVRKIDKTSYEEGLKWCNLITYHCPLYKDTKDYFNFKTLGELEHNSWLVNTARGGIVNEKTVAEGLSSGKLLGFSTDVYQSEPPEIKDFYKTANVFLTPHIGAYTQKAKLRLVEETLKVWASFVFEKKIINRIDQRFI